MILAKQKQQGFTLVEMMIAVAIVGIIAAIAYPNYIEQVIKSKRSDAKIGLQQLAQRQESYFSRTYSYASALSQLGYATDTIDSPEAQYTQTISVVTPGGCDGTRANACTGYTVQAKPKSDTSQTKDKDCVVFTLDNLGRKTAANGATASADTSSKCW